MNAEPAWYTIRVDGHLGATALYAFPSLAAEHQAAQTVLVGLLDRSALYGLLAQLEMLGLDLVEISRSAPAGPSPDPGGSTRRDGGADFTVRARPEGR